MSFNFNNTLGALEIGVLSSYFLLGVTITQTYTYYSRSDFPEDSHKLKALVIFVCVCEIAHAICIAHALHVWTISDYMHPEHIEFGPQSFVTAIFFSSLIAACLQGFLPHRIYALSKKLYISIVIWAMALMRLLGSIVLFAVGLRIPSIERFTAQWNWLIMAIWAVGAATDVATTAALVTILVRRRSFAQKRTKPLVDKLIVWAIETGLLTSASGIATLVCFALMPKNFIFLGVFVVVSRLYANTLLASLNSRKTLRTMNEASLPVSIAMMTETRQMSYDGPELTTHGGADKI